ncbi:YeeE/YedE family protein [Amorphus coralli]|uniref:YeeE/YedE family protein n=1 Tax=Amorphus coralli TaxID=340680 RepID=UPI0003711BE3|nr:YeeE/YedE thiosulfate transporter family protein [Amorphus coralli]
METAFTPLASLLGGILIGFASVALMALDGRIMGATGILSGAVFDRRPGDTGWRVALLLGMVSGPLVVLAATGSLPAVEVPVTTAALVVGGLIVGVGVTLGSGCTSGHGVCGMARLSLRSIVATLTFMVATFITVFVVRHVVGG